MNLTKQQVFKFSCFGFFRMMEESRALPSDKQEATEAYIEHLATIVGTNARKDKLFSEVSPETVSATSETD